MSQGEPPAGGPSASTAATIPADQGLRRGSVGFGGVLFQSITFMAPAIATAISIPAGAGFGGGALPLAILLALVASIFAALSIGQLTKHMPSAGSFYTYISTAIHPYLGFVVAWAFELAVLVGGVFLAVQLGFIVAGTLNSSLGWSANLWWIWMLLGSFLVFVFGYYGIRASTRVGELLGAFEILVFLILSITLIAKAGSHNTLHVFSTKFANAPGYKGFSGVVAASIFSILAFIGFEEAAPIAEEAHNPRRTVQLAVIVSCVAIGLFYVLNTYASTVSFGPLKMLDFVKAGKNNPWQDVLARSVWGTAGYVIVFIALLNSVIANQNAVNNSSTRNLYAMGRIRLLPRLFGRVNRYQAPLLALWTQLVITIAVSLWLGFQYDPYTAFLLTATILVDVFTSMFVLLNLACIVYYARYRRDEFNWVLHGLLPVLGIAAFIPAFLAGAGIPAFRFIAKLPTPLSYAGPVVGIWTAIGIIYLIYLAMRHPDRIAETRRIFVD
jgi:amino acid transporter